MLRASLVYPSHQKLEIVEGDLTRERVDAIVNAANAHLAHGGGVAAAIARAGGPEVQRESDAWVRAHGPVSHADPAVTTAGKMPAKYVIHAVGPKWGEGDEDRKLAEAVRGSLEQAEALSLSSIAFPAISTGIFGFPKDRAVPIFLETFKAYFEVHPDSSITLIRVVLLDQEMLELFSKGVMSKE
jgi:O-acetyl-ADP-ribose deacetylase